MTDPSPAIEDARIRAACRRFRLPAAEPVLSLAGDVGQRRYFRLGSKDGSPVVLVLYPAPSSASQEHWRVIGAALSEAGVRVPALLDDDPVSGAALVEDLGDDDLAAQIRRAGPAERECLLDEAEALLGRIRRITVDAARLNPPFDTIFFGAELAHTRRWALEHDGATPLSAGHASIWEEVAGRLARHAADPAFSGEAVPTHRDFHANNLMRTRDGTLAVIDFQDLRLGPPDYDPVSLRFERAGSLAPANGDSYQEAVLLQRAWKVLGTFEKMLALGREVYRPHRDAAIRAIRLWTRADGPFRPLLTFLPG